jgi:hypothetical protein
MTNGIVVGSIVVECVEADWNECLLDYIVRQVTST